MRLGWWVAAAAVFASWLLFHLPFTDLAELLLPRLGLANYDLLWNAIATALGIAVVGFIANREDWALTPVTRATLALLAGVVAAKALLLVAPIEYVHLPQYALLSVLLVKAGLPLEIAWLAAIGLGALDEGFQFLFLRRGRPDYFDWNDVVLNAIGASWGLVLLAAGRSGRFRTTFAGREVAVVVAIAALVAIAIAPVHGPPWLTQTPRGQWFRVLSPAEGILLIAAVWAATRGLAAAGVQSDKFKVQS